MKIVKSACSMITDNLSDPMKYIESIGRVCYKSEDNITDDSARKFIKQMVTHKHYAMLEHYRFIFKVDPDIYYIISQLNPRYMILSKEEVQDEFSDTWLSHVVSTSARGIIDLLDGYYGELPLYAYNTLCRMVVTIANRYHCKELFGEHYHEFITECNNIRLVDVDVLSDKEKYYHEWHSVRVVTDRGISHEIVRHRDASFAQESTRYCNYSKDKFNNEITVIEPLELSADQFDEWCDICKSNENAYFALLESGCTPQIARAVLPTCLKTELVITATNQEWDHIFSLRVSPNAHPQVCELFRPLEEYFVKTGRIER